MIAARIVRTPALAVLAATFVATAVALPEADAASQRGRGRGMSMMTLTPAGWMSGGAIPAEHTQAGAERSPALSWTGAPEGTESFVLIVHDATVPVGDGTDDLLYWMLWNIPATTTSLPAGIPSSPQLEDGTRQISATGPYYRGPAAAAGEPVHHVVFDLYALDTTINVPAVGESPAATRAAVMAAMAGHVRGKATAIGLHGAPRR